MGLFDDLIPKSTKSSGNKSDSLFLDLIPEFKFDDLPNWVTPQEKTIINHHRNNYLKGNELNKDGQTTTVNMLGMAGDDGVERGLIGYFNGKNHNSKKDADAIWDYNINEVGLENLPSWASPDEGNVAAQRLHKVIDKDNEKITQWKNRNTQQQNIDARRSGVDIKNSMK